MNLRCPFNNNILCQYAQDILIKDNIKRICLKKHNDYTKCTPHTIASDGTVIFKEGVYDTSN